MGAVNINNTGSGASVTLSSDGTDLLLNGSPIGGGGGGASPITISNKTGAYTVVAGDLGTIINCTSGTFTVSLTAAATLGGGFYCWIWNTGTDNITIDPNGAETIDGVTTLTLRVGEGTQIVCDGTNWITGDKKTMRGYAEQIPSSSTRPIVTGFNSVAIGPNTTASGNESIALGRYSTASASNSVGILGTASASSSAAIGQNSGGNNAQAVTGSGAMALGGSRASGTDSFAAAVANNTSSYGATGANSVAIGRFARASGQRSIVLGSDSCVASGTASVAVSANTATASGSYSMALGGGTASGFASCVIGPNSSSSATGQNSFAIGASSLASSFGKLAYSCGAFASNGDAQTGTQILRRVTSDATPAVLTAENGSPNALNQIILPNNSAYAFSGLVVARQQASGGTASAAWKIEGLIRREGSAGTTTLVASTVTAIDNTPGWTLALSADTTNGGLAVTATGAAATNIRWVATVQTSEVTY